jgi:hypothetical protein
VNHNVAFAYRLNPAERRMRRVWLRRLRMLQRMPQGLLVVTNLAGLLFTGKPAYIRLPPDLLAKQMTKHRKSLLGRQTSLCHTHLQSVQSIPN